MKSNVCAPPPGLKRRRDWAHILLSCAAKNRGAVPPFPRKHCDIMILVCGVLMQVEVWYDSVGGE